MKKIICTKLLDDKNGYIKIQEVLNLIPDSVEVFLFHNEYGVWIQTGFLEENIYIACKEMLGELIYEKTTNTPNIETANYGYVTSTIGLNIRQEANTTSEILNVLDYGQRFKIQSVDEEWYLISAPITGYIYKEYTNVQNQEISSVSNNLINFTASWEGFSAVPYKDAGGNWTVGFGICTYNQKPSPITWDQAYADLKETLENLAQEVYQITSELNLTQTQFDSLVDFAYNLGINALKTSDLLINIKQCLNNSIIIGDFTAWSYCDGQKLLGLERRRIAEAKMFLDGVYINN
ncbi:MAG: glycoside hydrolase family protein [Sarcina sp.]